MYASDLINKDNKINKFYFTKGGRQITVVEYKEHFIINQMFDGGKAFKYTIDKLESALTRLKNGAMLIETIRYK
jgi:hypothetical protein